MRGANVGGTDMRGAGEWVEGNSGEFATVSGREGGVLGRKRVMRETGRAASVGMVLRFFPFQFEDEPDEGVPLRLPRSVKGGGRATGQGGRDLRHEGQHREFLQERREGAGPVLHHPLFVTVPVRR